MADIKDRIKKIEPYFKGMQVDEADGEQIIYVMVNFPPKWIIQDDTPDKFDVSIGREDTLYYFCAKLEQGFDIIFDAIDYNIAEMKAALERSQIFRQKMAELQEIFADETLTIENLRTLDFTYKGKKKKVMQPKAQEENKEETNEGDENNE